MSAGDGGGFAIDPVTVRKWKRYPAYKDSEVEWLGEVPTWWEVRPLKRQFRIVNGGTPASSEAAYWDGDITWFTPEDLGKNETTRITSSGRQITKEGLQNCSAQIVPCGSIILSTRAPIGHIAITDVEACTNQGCRSLVPLGKGITTNFSYYVLFASKAVLQAKGKGTTFMELSTGDLGSHVVPSPPLPEQHAIAAFLDRETARLDALIAKKQRFIELLEEKRQALITQAVTKGLDPDAEIKDSGVEWLGEVPAGWDVKKISYLADKITNGYVGPTRDIFVDHGVTYLQSLHIKRNQIIFDYNYYVSEEWSHKHPRSILKAGDVLIVQTGDIGQVAVVPEEYEGANCHALIIVSCSPSIMKGEYLSMLLNSSYGFNSLKKIQTGALHPHLNYHNVKEIMVPVPPINDQARIIEQIVERSSNIDALINTISRQIEKLREYRTALISAAVTGNIDVRSEAPATP